MPIREDLLSNDFASVFSKAFQERMPLPADAESRFNASIQTAVYPLAILDAFLTAEHATAVAKELQSPHLTFQHRTTDLFDFHQTAGLESSIDPAIFPALTALVAELYAPPFVALLERILHGTAPALASTPEPCHSQSRLSRTKKTITAQRYRQGDFLLPHDDRLLNRRIAFILYFPIESESESCPGLEGGRLMTMRSDEQGRPVTEGARSLVPQFNRAAFFEVTRASFHQVEQIYSDTVPRYSVICWFHDLEEEESPATATVLSPETSADSSPETSANPSPETIQKLSLPMRLPSLLSESLLLGMLEEFRQLGQRVHRPAVKGTFLASSAYPTADNEPAWMRLLLQRSTSNWLQARTGLHLDWPTRPVAWLLCPAKHNFYNGSLMVDYQADVDYSYKTRHATAPNPHAQLHVSIHAVVQPGNRIRASTRLSTAPPRIKRHRAAHPHLDGLTILVTMKFAIISKNSS